MMNLGFAAVSSLLSIDRWIGNVNANMISSGRVGYKENRVSFNTSVASVGQAPGGGSLGTQFPGDTLNIQHTQTDFSQGAVVASSQDTHLAIQGKGFFVLAKESDAASGALDLNAPNYDYLLTRDGEFHFANVPSIHPTDPVLVNSKGLIVMADKAPFNAPFDNLYGTIRKSEWEGAGRIRPSIADASVDSNFLSYSAHGSTIWEGKFEGNRVPAATIVNGSANNLNDNGSRLIENALESSNASMSGNITQLALAPKLYSAITKTIVVHQKNVDDVMSLIR